MTTPSKTLDDMRNVGIGPVAPGSFLITGRPRVRSAWLAALLATDAMPVYHEAPLAKTPIDQEGPFGLIDPGAACLYPNLALEKFRDCTIIVIERSEKESRTALERLAGKKAEHWDAIEERYQFFRKAVKKRAEVLFIPFIELNEYWILCKLMRLTTNQILTQQRFELFDGLRIEQDFHKAQLREQAAA